MQSMQFLCNGKKHELRLVQRRHFSLVTTAPSCNHLKLVIDLMHKRPSVFLDVWHSVAVDFASDKGSPKDGQRPVRQAGNDFVFATFAIKLDEGDVRVVPIKVLKDLVD
jgi:hypothetical protein